MRFGKVLRDNRQQAGIKEFTSEYFELTFKKFDDVLTMVFMAPDIKKAKIKAKSILHTNNGSKIINIRKLNSKSLGPDISWQKDGTAYARFSKRNRKLRVRVKKG